VRHVGVPGVGGDIAPLGAFHWASWQTRWSELETSLFVQIGDTSWELHRNPSGPQRIKAFGLLPSTST